MPWMETCPVERQGTAGRLAVKVSASTALMTTLVKGALSMLEKRRTVEGLSGVALVAMSTVMGTGVLGVTTVGGVAA